MMSKHILARREAYFKDKNVVRRVAVQLVEFKVQFVVV